jgi:hypothetical protein
MRLSTVLTAFWPKRIASAHYFVSSLLDTGVSVAFGDPQAQTRRMGLSSRKWTWKNGAHRRIFANELKEVEGDDVLAQEATWMRKKTSITMVTRNSFTSP